MKIYNKLVRDKIPAIIEADGKKCKYSKAKYNKEYYLFDKLDEETEELEHAHTKEEILEELADVYEVLTAIASYHGIELDEVTSKVLIKRDERGAFNDFIILNSVKD